jgi:hypothetical protein
MKRLFVLVLTLSLTTICWGQTMKVAVPSWGQTKVTAANGVLMTDNAVGISTCTDSGMCSPALVTKLEINRVEFGPNLGRLTFGTGRIRSGNLTTGALLSGPGIISVYTNGQQGTPNGPVLVAVFNGAVHWTLSSDGSYYLLLGNILSTDGSNQSGTFVATVRAPLSSNGRAMILKASLSLHKGLH